MVPGLGRDPVRHEHRKGVPRRRRKADRSGGGPTGAVVHHVDRDREDTVVDRDGEHGVERCGEALNRGESLSTRRYDKGTPAAV